MRRKNNLILSMWPLVSFPCFSEWPNTHEHTGSTKWIQRKQKSKKDMKIEKDHVIENMGELAEVNGKSI